MNKFFKQVNKSKFTSEQEALNSVCEETGTPANKLQANHSAKMYRWELIDGDTPVTNEKKENLFTVEKDADYTLQDAKRKAMQHFNTFEGNIKIADQDETHIVFSKVRG
jgi:hypothetical protein